MSFSKIYAPVLSPFIEKYKMAKNEKERKAVKTMAVDAVLKSRDLLEDQGIDLPKDLDAVCLIAFFHIPIIFMMLGYRSFYQSLREEGSC
jgi:hypothetical protein